MAAIIGIFVVAWLLVIVTAAALRFVLVPPERVHDAVCLGCGYSLAGLDSSVPCPECGSVRPAPGAAAAAPQISSLWIIPWAVGGTVLTAATGPVLWRVAGMPFDGAEGIADTLLVLHGLVVCTAVAIVGAINRASVTPVVGTGGAGRLRRQRWITALSLLMLTGVHAAIVLSSIVQELRNPVASSVGYERPLALLLTPVFAMIAGDGAFIVLGLLAAAVLALVPGRKP